MYGEDGEVGIDPHVIQPLALACSSLEEVMQVCGQAGLDNSPCGVAKGLELLSERGSGLCTRRVALKWVGVACKSIRFVVCFAEVYHMLLRKD